MYVKDLKVRKKVTGNFKGISVIEKFCKISALHINERGSLQPRFMLGISGHCAWLHGHILYGFTQFLESKCWDGTIQQIT